MTGGRFLAELKRRRVFRVVGAYAIAAWVAVEVSATTFPLMGLSDAAVQVVLVVALVGFPVAVALAWVFDLTPTGIQRTEALDPNATPAPAPASSSRVPAHARALGMFGVGILVALVGFAAWSRFDGAGPAGGEGGAIRSIAVLPFVDMSAAGDQEYFADGITEELLNNLAQIEGLHVPARTSSFAFKGRNENVQEIARQLGVQAVLEGSIRRDGDQLRVTAQLIDARTGFHLWSNNYDRQAGEVFALQDELSKEIVDALRLRIAAADTAAGPSDTENARAHDLYLRGLARWHRRTPASLMEALDLFQRAVAEDSGYARAWAGLAQTYVLLPSQADYPFEEALRAGTRSAAKAIELDAMLPEAHGALGQIAQNFEWDLGGAERAYRRAVQFDSTYATGHQWYAETLLMLGRIGEAERSIGTALERDPLAPAALAVNGYMLLVTGRTPQALSAYGDLLRLYPDFTLGRLNLIFGLAATGQPAEAASEVESLGFPPELAEAARTALLRGPGLDAALARLREAQPPSLAALWHAAAGREDGAVRILEAGETEAADGNLPFVLIHPLFAPLHDDPGFRAVADRIGVVLPG